MTSASWSDGSKRSRARRPSGKYCFRWHRASPCSLDVHDDGLECRVGAVYVGRRWEAREALRLSTQGFCLTPETQGSIKRICTEGRERTSHRNPHSYIEDMLTASSRRLVPKDSMCAVKTRRLSRWENCVASECSARKKNPSSLFT